jgi:hypothetical protein
VGRGLGEPRLPRWRPGFFRLHSLPCSSTILLLRRRLKRDGNRLCGRRGMLGLGWTCSFRVFGRSQAGRIQLQSLFLVLGARANLPESSKGPRHSWRGFFIFMRRLWHSSFASHIGALPMSILRQARPGRGHSNLAAQPGPHSRSMEPPPLSPQPCLNQPALLCLASD